MRSTASARDGSAATAPFWPCCRTACRAWVQRPCRSEARALVDRVAAFGDSALGLRFKPPVLAPVEAGLRFCGMRLGPRGLRPGRRRERAWAGRWRALQADWRAGALTEAGAQRRAEVLRALCLPARPLAWQRAVMGGAFDLETFDVRRKQAG